MSKKKKQNIKELKLLLPIILILIVTLILYLVYNFSSFTTMNKDKFTKLMEENNLNIYDATNQFGEDYVETATVAYSTNANYQIEFIIFADKESAKNAFNINKKNFDMFKKDDDQVKTISNEKIIVRFTRLRGIL